jgi:hypothetical protein
MQGNLIPVRLRAEFSTFGLVRGKLQKKEKAVFSL